MMTNERLRVVRQAAELRQEDIAFLLGVGIATVNRWERPGTTLPTGLSRQVYEILDQLLTAGVPLAGVGARLRASGNIATVRWLLNEHAERRQDV